MNLSIGPLSSKLSFDALLGKGWSAGLAYACEFGTGVEERDVAFSGPTLAVTYACGD